MRNRVKRPISFILILCILITSFISVRAEQVQAVENPNVSEDAEDEAAASTDDQVNQLPIEEYRASGSDSNIPEYAIDGDITSRWSVFGDGQWIELDLGSQKEVSYLGVAFYRGDNRAKAIDIEVSNDQTTWTKVYSGTSSGTTIQLEAFGFETVTARYVRVVGRGENEWTSITEIHLYPPHPDGFVLNDLEIPPTGPDPDAPIPTKPGLYYADGKPHKPHEPQAVKGRKLNAVAFGANPSNNGEDDAKAIREALNKAKPGDIVYLPNGHYQLSSMSNDGVSHLTMKSGVQLRGETQDGVLLVSDHANEFGEHATNYGIVIRIAAQNNIKISNMTITSSWNLNYSTDTRVANPDRGGPKQAIYITSSGGKPSYNITLDRLTVEKFQRIGVAIINSHDVIVENSLFRNATDVAEGGSGYGVSIEGKPKESRLGREDDSYFNVVRHNRFIGPYLRHGTLMQFYTHNNLIENNKYKNIALDSIDFHGEDEYMNEVRFNHIVGGGEAAIGVGNPGATHDAAGPGNYIHNNVIKNVDRYGIQVYLGSPKTVIENNTIIHFTKAGSQGIRLKNAPGTIVKNNKIYDNKANEFWGIIALEDKGDPGNAGNGAGIPKDIVIQNNRVTGNTNGVNISYGTNILLSGNKISANTETDYVNSVAIPKQLSGIEAASVQKNASAPLEASDLLVKGGDDDSTIRTYLKYDLSQLSGKIATARLYVYGRALESKNEKTTVANSLYGVEDDSWNVNDLMWDSNDAPPALGDHLSTIKVKDDGVDAWYVFDVTLFVKDQLAGDKTASLAIAQNPELTGYLTQLYNGEGSDKRPYLRVETYPVVELASVTVTADKTQLAPNTSTLLHASGKMNTGSDTSLEDAEIVYESLTPELASVDSSGEVTALKEGNAVIKVTATLDGVTKSGTIMLIVTNNLAITAQLSVDSTLGTNVKERVVDGNLSTRWLSSGTQPPFLKLDWTSAQTINQVKLWSGHVPVTGSAGWHVKDFDLEYLDGSEWKTLQVVRNNDKDAFKEQFTLLEFDPIMTTSIRFKFVSPSWKDTIARINEVDVKFVQ
ncbi:discoidin domain-containing protein [Metabacillus arenae]|uniref:Discoidin domain-containing protein n=1 Tax=Metabacillus arenae TaxID=2771434 RepID=A0A926NAL8_9BACI|nr:discoidin domain-containing protein [Metabacillus arenae]MBD1380662.1 discoidin domain-containing protein [Metabacillus arenae]